MMIFKPDHAELSHEFLANLKQHKLYYLGFTNWIFDEIYERPEINENQYDIALDILETELYQKVIFSMISVRLSNELNSEKLFDSLLPIMSTNNNRKHDELYLCALLAIECFDGINTKLKEMNIAH